MYLDITQTLPLKNHWVFFRVWAIFNCDISLFEEYWQSKKHFLVGGLEHFLCFHILGIVTPTDFHIFQSGSTINEFQLQLRGLGPKLLKEWDPQDRKYQALLRIFFIWFQDFSPPKTRFLDWSKLLKTISLVCHVAFCYSQSNWDDDLKWVPYFSACGSTGWQVSSVKSPDLLIDSNKILIGRPISHSQFWVSINGGTQIIHFNRIFHYKAFWDTSIYGTPPNSIPHWSSPFFSFRYFASLQDGQSNTAKRGLMNTTNNSRRMFSLGRSPGTPVPGM